MVLAPTMLIAIGMKISVLTVFSPRVCSRSASTATIATYVSQDGKYRTLATNGKPDASLAISASEVPAPDWATTVKSFLSRKRPLRVP